MTFDDFAPVSKAEAAAASAPAPVAAVAPGVVVPATATLVARIVSDRARSRTHDLDWPVEFGGVLYERIVVARPTAAQVADYFERAIASPEETVRFPVFFDEAGARVPDAVMDALDAQDAEDIMDGIASFLPGRLRALAGL